jgi:hypothetical protein
MHVPPLDSRGPVRALVKLAAIFVVLGTFWLARTWLLTEIPFTVLGPGGSFRYR